MTSQQCTLTVHPFTGMPAIGIVAGRPVWPILGAAEEAADPPGAAGSGDAGQPSGFTPPASQADLDRIIQERVRRATAPYADYADWRAKGEKHDELELELGSAADKAAAAARAEERTKAVGEFSPRLVKAEFKAAAADQKLDKAKLDGLLEDIDLSKYMTATGEVDEDKIAKKVALWAPPPQQRGPRDLGQGQHDPGKPSAKEAGIAEAKKRFGAKTAGAA